jgi:hypothetical protein
MPSICLLGKHIKVRPQETHECLFPLRSECCADAERAFVVGDGYLFSFLGGLKRTRLLLGRLKDVEDLGGWLRRVPQSG